MRRFHCAGCGACCRWQGIVRLDDGDIAAIAAFLRLPEQEFIDKWTCLAPDRRCLVLKDREDGACCFLTADNRCQIHPVKPRQCGAFPTEWQESQEFMALCQGTWSDEP